VQKSDSYSCRYSVLAALWLLRRLLAAGFPCPAPHLWFTGDQFVGELSAVGQPTTNSAFHPSWVGKW